MKSSPLTVNDSLIASEREKVSTTDVLACDGGSAGELCIWARVQLTKLSSLGLWCSLGPKGLAALILQTGL